jgi:protein gp37
MAQNTNIEWSECSWNPVTGCNKISPGCKNCYAERMAHRLQAMGQENYRNGFEVTTHQHMLLRPFEWRKPKMIFVNSMSDLFHKNVKDEFIEKIFDVMQYADHHEYQILTKRSQRLVDLAPLMAWTENIWMGVSVESKDYLFRIDHLRETPAHIKFISFEPLLGSIAELDLTGIDWVIVGGESGPRARPMKKEWVTDIRDKCMEADVPLFFKQWGGVNKKKAGCLLDGRIWNQMPERKSS